MEDTTVGHIKKLEDMRYDAMLNADSVLLAELLHPRLTYIHSSGVTDTQLSYIDGVAKGVWKYKSISRTKERIELLGSAALVFNHLHIDLDVKSVPKTVKSHAMAVWVWDAGSWKLLAVQSASLED